MPVLSAASLKHGIDAEIEIEKRYQARYGVKVSEITEKDGKED